MTNTADDTVNPFAAQPALMPDTGSYIPFAVMSDGEVLCRFCVVDPANPVEDRRGELMPDGNGWEVIAFDHSGNLEELEGPDCAHCGRDVVGDAPELEENPGR